MRRKDDRQDSFIFDLDEGERRKEQGMAQAEAPLSRKQLVEVARDYAERIARRDGSVTSDDYFREMRRDGYDPTQLGPAAGCVFHDSRFVFTGTWRKSQRVTNHASDLRVWRLRQEKKDVQSVGQWQAR